MSQKQLPSPEVAFNEIKTIIMELPTKVGPREQTEKIWDCLESLKGAVERDLMERKAQENAKVALPVSVPPKDN